MNKVIEFVTNPKFRIWMYGVTLAVLPLLTFLTAEERTLWANLVMFILAVGAPATALKNYTGSGTETEEVA